MYNIWLKKKRYNLIHCNKSKVLDTIINLTFDILIIDKLNLKNSFLSEIRKAKKQNIKIVLFGNLTSANNFADLVINAMIGSDFENKDYYIGKTHYLVGPKYLTLREEFKHNSYVYKNNLKKYFFYLEALIKQIIHTKLPGTFTKFQTKNIH